MSTSTEVTKAGLHTVVTLTLMTLQSYSVFIGSATFLFVPLPIRAFLPWNRCFLTTVIDCQQYCCHCLPTQYHQEDHYVLPMTPSRLLFVVVLHGAIVNSVNAQQLWKFALGYTDQTYTDYTVVESITDSDTANAIADFYNGIGGIPSLGSPATQENCDLVWNFNGEETVTCNCGGLPVANDVASLAPGATPNQCYGSLSASMLTSATPNSDGKVTIFKSSLPPGCDPQCELHGACSQSGTGCICAPQSNASSFYWTGAECSVMRPGEG